METLKLINRWYLENTHANHNKFYDISIHQSGEKYILTKRWGRIGSQGTTSQKEYLNLGYAISSAQKKVQEEIRKGYDVKIWDFVEDQTGEENDALEWTPDFV